MLGSLVALKLSNDMPNLPNTELPKSLSLPEERRLQKSLWRHVCTTTPSLAVLADPDYCCSRQMLHQLCRIHSNVETHRWCNQWCVVKDPLLCLTQHFLLHFLPLLLHNGSQSRNCGSGHRIAGAELLNLQQPGRVI